MTKISNQPIANKHEMKLMEELNKMGFSGSSNYTNTEMEEQIQFVEYLTELKNLIVNGGSKQDIQALMSTIEQYEHVAGVAKNKNLLTLAKSMITNYEHPMAGKTPEETIEHLWNMPGGILSDIANWFANNEAGFKSLFDQMNMTDFSSSSQTALENIMEIFMSLIGSKNASYSPSLEQDFLEFGGALFSDGIAATIFQAMAYKEADGNPAVAKQIYDRMIDTMATDVKGCPQYSKILEELKSTPFPSSAPSASDLQYALQQVFNAFENFEGIF